MIVLVAYSTKPMPRKDQCQDDRQLQAQPDRLRGPAHRPEQAVEQRERHVEEHHLLERGLERRRVGRLQRVQHDVAGQQPLDPDRPDVGLHRVGLGLGRRGAQRGNDVGQGAGRHHEVQRDQQVRGRPSRLDRDAKWQRDDDQRREQPRMGGDQPGHSGQHGDRQYGCDHRHQGMAVGHSQLGRVPDLGQQEDRGQHQSAQHRQRPSPPLTQQQDRQPRPERRPPHRASARVR